MKKSTINAIDKFIQAKKLEKEAFFQLLPDNISKHMEVIHEEVKQMVLEVATDLIVKNNNCDEKSTKVSSQDKVKKVKVD